MSFYNLFPLSLNTGDGLQSLKELIMEVSEVQTLNSNSEHNQDENNPLTLKSRQGRRHPFLLPLEKASLHLPLPTRASRSRRANCSQHQAPVHKVLQVNGPFVVPRKSTVKLSSTSANCLKADFFV